MKRRSGRRRTSKDMRLAKTARQGAASKLTQRRDAARDRVFKALWAVRQGDSLSKAARDNGVTVRTVKRYVGSALVQDRPGGRIRATKSDHLVRYLQIAGPNGPRDVTARGSKIASEFARYKADTNRLLRGDRHAMDKWRGKKIAGIELITDPKILIEQARKDMLPYSLYRSFSGGAA